MTQTNTFNSELDIELLRGIVEMLPTSIFVKDENLNFILSNAAHSDLIGSPESELLGKSDSDMYPLEESAGYLAVDRAVMQSGKTLAREETATGKHGFSISLLTRKTKFTATNGRTYLIGTNTDMQEIHDREEALTAKEAHYRALAESVPGGIWHVSKSGKTLYANPFLSRLFALPSGEFSDQSLRKMTNLNKTESLAQLIGTARTLETDVTVQGKVVARVMIVSSGWLAEGDDASAFVNFVDITQLNDLLNMNDEITRLNKELSEKINHLHEAQDQILRAGKMAQIGQLTATVAHELRNPLAAVRTSTFLLERKLKGKDCGVEAQIERINNGIVRCDKIITQLLDFARTKSLQTKSVEFDAWLTQIATEEIAKLPSMLNVQYKLNLPGLIAAFDAEQFSRCVINLLTNASEAMLGKTGEINTAISGHATIMIETKLTDRGVEVWVHDNGPGMAPEILARIREPLFTTKSFGTGLGLPAVENIMLQHQGGLEIHSKLGEGSRFVLWFPVNQERAAQAA